MNINNYLLYTIVRLLTGEDRMCRDPMADEITENQVRAWRSLNSPQYNEETDRMIREQGRKIEILSLLKSDPKFREEVRRILHSQE